MKRKQKFVSTLIEKIQILQNKVEELEDELNELKMNKRFSKETVLFNTLQEIYESCINTLKQDKENQRFNFKAIDFKQAIVNLKKFIEELDEDNNLKLIN